MLCDRSGTVVERRGVGMTENIAIYCLKAASELNPEMCEECPLYGQTGADHCCEDALQVAIKALEELQQYRAIGTVEECWAAMERHQRAKNLIFDKSLMVLSCPTCGHYAQEVVDGDGSTRGNIPKYCSRCGQRLDWRANDGKTD